MGADLLDVGALVGQYTTYCIGLNAPLQRTVNHLDSLTSLHSLGLLPISGAEPHGQSLGKGADPGTRGVSQAGSHRCRWTGQPGEGTSGPTPGDRSQVPLRGPGPEHAPGSGAGPGRGGNRRSQANVGEVLPQDMGSSRSEASSGFRCGLHGQCSFHACAIPSDQGLRETSAPGRHRAGASQSGGIHHRHRTAAGGDLTPRAQALLSGVSNPRNSPPLPEAEIRTMVRSAYQGPKRTFGCRPDGGLRRALECVGQDRCLYKQILRIRSRASC